MRGFTVIAAAVTAVAALAAGCGADECPAGSCMVKVSPTPPRMPPGPIKTVVSLTFDDGRDDAYAAKDALGTAGIKGTFFIITGIVGVPGYMTWAQILDLQANGHEIGGHTVNHVPLAGLKPATLQSEVCGCRTALLAQGVAPATSFSYPFNSIDTPAEAAVQQCGFALGRAASGLDPVKGPVAESIPPQDPFRVRTDTDIQTNDTLDTLEQRVLAAESAGGWLTLVFHHVTDVPMPLSVSPATLQQFAVWLAARSSGGTAVMTFGDAARLTRDLRLPRVDDASPRGTAAPTTP